MSKQAATKTILVVDDDPRSIRLMEVVLGHAGYRVLAAGNAEAGLDVLACERPDLVMVDLLMPGMDGIGFCRKAKELTGHGTLRLVLFTAMVDLDTRRRALQSGADDVLVKPFDRHELLLRLGQLLASSD